MEPSGGSAQAPPQVREGGWRAIGHPSLRLRPDEFRRVELRGVPGEVRYVKSGMGPEEGGHQGALMDRGPVPQEDDGPPEVPQERPEEAHDLCRMIVRGLPPDVEPQVVAPRRDGERR